MANLAMASLISFFFIGIAFFSENAHAHPPKPGVKARPFTYTDTNSWANLEADYKPCSTGKVQQSPVNILTKNAVANATLKPLTEDYVIHNATLMTNGLVVQLLIKGKSDLIIEGEPYRLLNIRWHAPSEHLIDGVQYAAEMHQVHAAHNNTVVIVSTLYQVGEADPILTALQPQYEELAAKCDGNDNERKAEDVPMKNFPTEMLKKIPMDKYFTYRGSLTTPPCMEVTWYVLKKIQTICKGQVTALSVPLGKSNKKNARPVQAQPLDGKEIQTTSP